MMPCSGPLSAAAFNAPLTSSALVSRAPPTVRSTTEPVGTGARTAKPFSLPCSAGITSPIAFAAPVEAGIRLIAAARARRRSLCGMSCKRWSAVYAWIVVITPCLMPTVSFTAFATGPRQLVVHEAFEITSCLARSYTSSKFTPSTTVASGSLATAETITFLAPPARCLAAFARSVNTAVDLQRALAGLHRAGVSAEDRVVGEQVRECLRVGQVIDRHPLDRVLSA